MQYVFRINEELASITVTATELLSISKALTRTIRNAELKSLYCGIAGEINKSYGVVIDSFTPFFQLDTEENFNLDFAQRHETFKSNYLLDVSKPRKYCDNVYDAYIQLQQSKEAKSSFPTLSRNFARLDRLYDKWITNDNFLGLSIDAVLKQKNLLLDYIAERKKKDEEEGWEIFSCAFEDFRPYLSFIAGKSEQIAAITNG